jgi:hypothetical protein
MVLLRVNGLLNPLASRQNLSIEPGIALAGCDELRRDTVVVFFVKEAGTLS